jgi:pilus assembly protein FimV
LSEFLPVSEVSPMKAVHSPGAARWCLRGLALMAVLLASGAHALTLGNASLHSRIGEPLRASIDLGRMGSLRSDEVLVRRGSAGDYTRFGIDSDAASSPMSFEVKIDEKGNGSIEVRSERPVTEPYVDMVVEVRWPNGRIVKEFVLLLDLPPQR